MLFAFYKNRRKAGRKTFLPPGIIFPHLAPQVVS